MCESCLRLKLRADEAGEKAFPASLFDLSYDTCPECGAVFLVLSPKPTSEYERCVRDGRLHR